MRFLLSVLMVLGLVALGLAIYFRDELRPSRPPGATDTQLACKECKHPRGAPPILL